MKVSHLALLGFLTVSQITAIPAYAQSDGTPASSGTDPRLAPQIIAAQQALINLREAQIRALTTDYENRIQQLKQQCGQACQVPTDQNGTPAPNVTPGAPGSPPVPPNSAPTPRSSYPLPGTPESPSNVVPNTSPPAPSSQAIPIAPQHQQTQSTQPSSGQPAPQGSQPSSER